ncbi:MAG TPA: FtsW/RodA/SpoVE family cell cycle protein, partial [Stellaceae bacterium]|nr:FtsW/RodA/SpoVE family cell cycle protein [Stellaceae bacterium]
MAVSFYASSRQPELTLAEKVWSLNWGLVLIVSTLAGVGFATLFSAANGHWDPWASKQMLRFAVAFVMMVTVALVDIRIWFRAAYAIYAVSFVLLVAVDLRGAIGMGAQRWIDLGVIQLQPSELMKVALVLALARYFHGLSIEDIGRPLALAVPVLLVVVPAGLVMKQPDLGTAMMLVLGGGMVFFLAGVRLWMFAAVVAAGLSAVPIV